jgi:hypothetical protein
MKKTIEFMINHGLDATTLSEIVRDLLVEHGLSEASDAQPFGFEVTLMKFDEVALEFNDVKQTTLRSHVFDAQ